MEMGFSEGTALLLITAPFINQLMEQSIEEGIVQQGTYYYYHFKVLH